MSKPKHRRCGVCDVVTARYSHIEQQGPFMIKVWVRDSKAGEALPGGGVVRCTQHADQVPALPWWAES